MQANLNQSNVPRPDRALYRRTLLDDVVPFWLRHGLDRQYGGIGNVIDDRGVALSHDKYIWSQGRALWTFAALYNRIEPRPEWLDAARHVFRYIETHGRDRDGRWMYRLAPDGSVIDRDISIYVDGFVMYGLGEYFKACAEPAARQMAEATYANVKDRLANPGTYGVAPYEIPQGLKTHGIAMIFSHVFFELGRALDREDMQRHGLRLAWDQESGGLRLALDIDRQSPCFWKQPDIKAWWVHCEALVATACANRQTGERWCLEWHARVRDYAFAHYPVATGEWTQWLDRQGRPAPSAALPVKDPFHLPRALIMLITDCASSFSPQRFDSQQPAHKEKPRQ